MSDVRGAIRSVDVGSVWVANAAELPGFDVTPRTARSRKPLFHGL